jgi:hypothetical protein
VTCALQIMLLVLACKILCKDTDAAADTPVKFKMLFSAEIRVMRCSSSHAKSYGRRLYRHVHTMFLLQPDLRRCLIYKDIGLWHGSVSKRRKRFL